MIESRQYQEDDVNYAMHHGVDDKIIHCSPTGSGKTVIQCCIAKRELDRGDHTAIRRRVTRSSTRHWALPENCAAGKT